MEKNLEEILSQFDSTKNNYERLLEYIEATIKSLMENEKIQIHEIKGRIKDKESLSKKIETKDYKYSSLSEITDICGIRIITYFSDDVDKIASLLEEEFDLDQDNSIDKRKTQDPTKFGYVSLHYILKLDWYSSLLIGSVLGSTDAASVFAILRSHKLNLKENTASLLEIESGSNDPFAYVLTIAFLTLSKGNLNLPLLLFKQVCFGLAVGYIFARVSCYIIRKVL